MTRRRKEVVSSENNTDYSERWGSSQSYSVKKKGKEGAAEIFFRDKENGIPA